ncbi:MAG: alpha/beta hydrolase [Streptosporangiaceae bacterium]
MRTEEVTFYSEGARLAGLWRTRGDDAGLRGAIVQGPGWLGLRDAQLYLRYHEALTAAGFGVLVFDYRGFGGSEGDRGRLSLHDQLIDLGNGVTYVATRSEVDADAIGLFGSGGTGGGNAVVVAARDPRVRAVVSQVPVADGADWLHRMRSEHEWRSFLALLEEDRHDRVIGGKGRLVHPEEIMVPTPERRATSVKADVDDRIPTAVPLAAADELLDYRPAESARTLRTPLLVVAVEDDATTPVDHAVALYEAAQGPRRLVLQRHTSHYASYDRYWKTVTPLIVDWFERYLGPADVVVRSAVTSSEQIEYLRGQHVD